MDNPNINEFGRFFRRHSYNGKQIDRILLAILGLIATMGDIYGWDVRYPVEKMFKLVSDENNLRRVLGGDILDLIINLITHENCGCYVLVYDDNDTPIYIEPNHDRFIETVAGYTHEYYLVGSDSANKG